MVDCRHLNTRPHLVPRSGFLLALFAFGCSNFLPKKLQLNKAFGKLPTRGGQFCRLSLPQGFCGVNFLAHTKILAFLLMPSLCISRANRARRLFDASSLQMVQSEPPRQCAITSWCSNRFISRQSDFSLITQFRCIAYERSLNFLRRCGTAGVAEVQNRVMDLAWRP